MMKIEVRYDTEGRGINGVVDRKIIKAMKIIGAKWYASGTDVSGEETGMRDIAFDLDEKEVR